MISKTSKVRSFLSKRSSFLFFNVSILAVVSSRYQGFHLFRLNYINRILWGLYVTRMPTQNVLQFIQLISGEVALFELWIFINV